MLMRTKSKVKDTFGIVEENQLTVRKSSFTLRERLVGVLGGPGHGINQLNMIMQSWVQINSGERNITIILLII